MKIHTKTVFQWNEDGSFTRLEDEFHDYDGPVALANPVAAIAGSAVVSAISGKKSADKAAAATQGAADTATEESRRQFDTVRGDTAVQRAGGDAALYQLANLLGIQIPGSVTSSSGVTPGPSMTPQQALEGTPGYTFRLGESQKAIDRMQSAGRITGGRALKEGVRYAQDYGSGEFQNIINNLFRVSGIGGQGVGTSANAGMSSAGQVGNAAMSAGAGGANAAYQGGMAVNNAVQGGVQNYMTLRNYNDIMNSIRAPSASSIVNSGYQGLAAGGAYG